ncbi:hypothetical protein SODALDRAFT_331635 [Sodiomyces alkalinus F11]|uniref:DUF3669 domain-containing protein n=1 Tax=Sodiomyces alkalinus (strain CBS 110278 / VKM F-3762 / F11) TaxID=1314773 RepID=A0A3N2PYE4_SODAK|nr:hypothetical protein SODALDRAFT_331635 [Sodiomyces alkalinus F11]ROT39517.1 hypothetical protein SODALDRAFT_331635 [Sodiomyces alkalinus F11]
MSSAREPSSSNESSTDTPTPTPSCTPPIPLSAAQEFASLSDTEALKQALALKSVIYTHSSYFSRVRQARDPNREAEIIVIGEGTQGTIFEMIGDGMVVKKEKPEQQGRMFCLQEEFTMHIAVNAAFKRYRDHARCDVLIPYPFYYVPKDYADFWNELEHDFHSLRNFHLTLPEMEELGMDVKALAAQLGKAFAIMHWGAEADGNDVEFVLGTRILPSSSSSSAASSPSSSPSSSPGSPRPARRATAWANEDPNFQRREVNLFMVDFGRCNRVSLRNGPPPVVYQLYKAAMASGANELYVPHPRQTPRLFRAFRQAYVEVAEAILKDRGLQNRFNADAFMWDFEDYAEVCLKYRSID